MSLGGNQKPRSTWWSASSRSSGNWFSAVKAKLGQSDSKIRSLNTGTKVGLKQPRN
jgi:hypothetical protein